MSTEYAMSPCGIDCSTCEIFRAAHDPQEARRLAEAWRAGGNANAMPEWFRCQGCRGDRNVRWKSDCRIAACCAEQGLLDCSRCADFPCDTYRNWIGTWPHHRAAYERLCAKRQSGN